jgi:hypothetical protein
LASLRLAKLIFGIFDPFFNLQGFSCPW